MAVPFSSLTLRYSILEYWGSRDKFVLNSTDISLRTKIAGASDSGFNDLTTKGVASTLSAWVLNS